MKTDEQSGHRVMIRHDGERHYLYVSDTDIMFSGPNESSIRHQEKYSTINLICRLVSKARSAGLGWDAILKQFDSVDVTGGRTLVSQIAAAVKGVIG